MSRRHSSALVADRWRLIVRCCWLVLTSLSLVACTLPGTGAGPPPTPTSVLDPYNAVVATAEAEGDTVAQAAAYYERGNQYFTLGDYAAALADYDQAVELDSTHARAFNNRGLAHALSGNPERAMANYDAALRLDPTYARAHKNRLSLLEQQSNEENTLREIAATYAQLAELEPENRADYLYQQGSALYDLRDQAGARQAFDAALAADPQQVDALYERALLNLAEGRADAALADLDRALRLSPRAANAYYARGLAQSAAGDQQRAISDFNAALRLRENYAEALLGRAAAYHATNDTEAALADLERLAALELDETLATAVAVLRAQMDES